MKNEKTRHYAFGFAGPDDFGFQSWIDTWLVVSNKDE
jgi:hypothetical protein